MAPVLAGQPPVTPQSIEAHPTLIGRVPGPGPNGGSQTAQEQRPPSAHIMVEVDGKSVGQYSLNKPVMTIGRLSSNDIHVPSQRVSRLHAKIRASNGHWIIEDAESLNGLVYQGQRVDHIVLNAGDRVFVAPSAVLQYQTA
jgi:pSer/pThr/pTyr-binding forkhead associated (FHA) protein